MRGSFLHNSMVAQVERAFRVLGAIVHREHRIAPRTLDGFVDLFIAFNSKRIVGEVELTTDRIHRDLAKAEALKADFLLIVVPNGRLVRAAQRRVDELKATGQAARLSILCLTMGAVLARLKDCNGFDVGLNVLPTTIQQIPTRTAKPRESSARK